MLRIKSKSDKYYLVASLVLIACMIVVHDRLSLTHQEKAEHTPTVSKAQLNIIEEHNKVIRFSNKVFMPPPPSKPNSVSVISSVSASSNVSYSNEHKSKQNKASNQKTTKNSLQASDVQTTLSSLQRLDGQQLQLTYPSSHRLTLQIIQYMYQCVGIDVGAIKDGSMVVLSNNLKQSSPLLRLVSGTQLDHEQNLIRAYARGADLVRVYPNWFDIRLSKHILAHTNGQELFQLSGEYRLIDQALYLTKVKVNNFDLQKNWALTNSQLCYA